jgi:rubrerythrin
MPITLAQAIRTALEAEHNATQFYEQLATRSAGQRVRQLFDELAAQERDHAARLEALGARDPAFSSAASVDVRAVQVESSPEWLRAAQIDLRQALQVAIESEHNAQLYYDAMASSCAREVAGFFESMARTEARHAAVLEQLLQRLDEPRAPDELYVELTAEPEAG